VEVVKVSVKDEGSSGLGGWHGIMVREMRVLTALVDWDMGWGKVENGGVLRYIFIACLSWV